MGKEKAKKHLNPPRGCLGVLCSEIVAGFCLKSPKSSTCVPTEWNCGCLCILQSYRRLCEWRFHTEMPRNAPFTCPARHRVAFLTNAAGDDYVVPVVLNCCHGDAAGWREKLISLATEDMGKISSTPQKKGVHLCVCEISSEQWPWVLFVFHLWWKALQATLCNWPGAPAKNKMTAWVVRQFKEEEPELEFLTQATIPYLKPLTVAQNPTLKPGTHLKTIISNLTPRIHKHCSKPDMNPLPCLITILSNTKTVLGF